VTKAFTPSAIENLRPRVQQLVDDVLDAAQERGTMELVDELAFPVPFQVISDLLAMPTDRGAELRDWSQHLTASLEPTATDETMDAAEAAIEQLVPYLIEIIDARRRNLGDDLLSGLLVAEEAGDRLTTDELIAFVVLLYVAGHETTVNLIGNGTLALLRNPDQMQLWRDDPRLDATAVDELLRFDGPVQLTVRVPMVDVTYGPWADHAGNVRYERWRCRRERS
jgi:cytochrome P450